MEKEEVLRQAHQATLASFKRKSARIQGVSAPTGMPGETVTRAEYKGLQKLIKDCRMITKLEDLDELEGFNCSALIKQSNVVEDLVVSGYVVLGPAEYIEHDETEMEDTPNGLSAWVFRMDENEDIHHLNFVSYVNKIIPIETIEMLTLDDSKDELVHPVELGIKENK